MQNARTFPVLDKALNSIIYTNSYLRGRVLRNPSLIVSRMTNHVCPEVDVFITKFIYIIVTQDISSSDRKWHLLSHVDARLLYI